MYPTGNFPSLKDSVTSLVISGANDFAHVLMTDVGILSSGDELDDIERISFLRDVSKHLSVMSDVRLQRNFKCISETCSDRVFDLANVFDEERCEVIGQLCTVFVLSYLTGGSEV